MMKKRGRFLAGITALMLTVMLSGCGGDKYEEVVATTVAVEATAAVEPIRQSVVLETEPEETTAAVWEPEERIEVDGKIRSYLTGEMVDVDPIEHYPLVAMLYLRAIPLCLAR